MSDVYVCLLGEGLKIIFRAKILAALMESLRLIIIFILKADFSIEFGRA